jgi:trigger factor
VPEDVPPVVPGVVRLMPPDVEPPVVPLLMPPDVEPPPVVPLLMPPDVEPLPIVPLLVPPATEPDDASPEAVPGVEPVDVPVLPLVVPPLTPPDADPGIELEPPRLADVPPEASGVVLDVPGALIEPEVPPELEPGDAAGELAIVCASRLHALKSLCVGSAASAMLQKPNTLAAVSTAVARVFPFVVIVALLVVFVVCITWETQRSTRVAVCVAGVSIGVPGSVVARSVGRGVSDPSGVFSDAILQSKRHLAGERSLPYPPTSRPGMPACESGGTGRRAGLRIQWLTPWGFESPLSHHSSHRPTAGPRVIGGGVVLWLESTPGSPMKVAVEEIEGCKRRLAVEAPADVVRQEWERAYGRVQKQARLPGFRKGHVPRSLVKLHFAGDVRREVAEHLIPDVYRQALSEARIEPVNEPDLQDVRLEEDAPLSFVAVVEVKPAITLGEYRGLEVQHAAVPVGDADVDEALGQMREQHAEFRNVERPAAAGDLVIVDYTLTPEGKDAATATGYQFLVGSSAVMPEIDEAVVGMAAGDERSVGVRFPDNYRVEELRGRSGSAVVKLNEVKEKVLPALDDEFARALGQFESLEQVREELRKQLEVRRVADERRQLEDKVIEALLGRHEFAVPEALVVREVSHQIEHARERMRRQGVDPDRLPWDYAKLIGELRPAAEKIVKRSLILEALAERETLAPTEQDVDAELERLAGMAQRPAPALRRMMEKSGDLDGLRTSLRERQALDFLVRHASIRE